MVKRKNPVPPSAPATLHQPRGILELERFSEASLQQWETASRDLDEIQDSLFFGTEPERRRYRPDLIAALKSIAPINLVLSDWHRLVTYRYSLAPLSCAGSLQDIGGRFNAGTDLDPQTLDAWPALYLAEDYETAFREKFQIESGCVETGLSPQELALQHGCSHASIVVEGRLSNVFDMTSVDSLSPVACVFRRIKMPVQAKRLKLKMNIKNGSCFMVQTGKQIHDMIFKQNWRLLPRQFGLPAQSQTLAELIRAAGFEAILYQSSKGPKRCLAVFPDHMMEESYIKLSDEAPKEVLYPRLDIKSSPYLEGWDSVPRQLRNR